MNLRVWLIAGILFGFTVPFSLAESRWPIAGISFTTQASTETVDQEIKSCEAGKDADLRITTCTEIIRKNPDATHKLGLAYFLRGNAYQTKQDYEHAIADYDESLRLVPSFAPVVKNRGMAYAHKGDYDRSIEDLEQFLRLEGNDPKVTQVLVIVYNNRGLGYGRNNDYERAIQDFSKALALNPDFTEAISNRGAYEARKNDYDRAIEDFEQVLRLHPDDPRATESLVIAYGIRAVRYGEKEDYDRALEDCNKSLRLRPDNPEALSNRGGIELDKHDYDHAIQDFDQALRLNPKLVGSLLGRGIAHYKKNQFDEAMKDFDEALHLDPGNKMATFERNRTLLVTGELNRAPAAPSAEGSAKASSKERATNPAFAVKNLPAFQSTFHALKSSGTYRGFAWPGLYEISNPTDKTITITDFRVLWRPASLQGQQLNLITRSKPDRIKAFDDLDALIKSQNEKSDHGPAKFPITVPPHTTRYVVVDFVFDVFFGKGSPVEFKDEREAYRLLSSALGWKPNSEGKFDCLNEDITVEISTTDRERLKFESLTRLLVPGCALYLPPKPPQSLAVPNFSIHGPSNANSNPGLESRFYGRVLKGISVEDYTKVVVQEPNNADAF